MKQRSTEEVIRLGADVEHFVKSEAGVAALASMNFSIFEEFKKAETLEQFRRAQARALNLEHFGLDLQRMIDDKDFAVAKVARSIKKDS